jgi:hypothetical protein
MPWPAAGAGPRLAGTHRPDLGLGLGLAAVSEGAGRQGRPSLVYGDVVYLRFADALGAEFATAVVATEQARARAVPAAAACAAAPGALRRAPLPRLRALRAPVRVGPAKGGRCVWAL